MTLVNPVVLVAVGGISMEGLLEVTVTEVDAPSVNPWSVTVQSSPLSLAGAPDISAANLSVKNRATAATGLLPGVTVADTAGSDGDLSAPRTLFTVNGETGLLGHNGVFTHTATIGLQVPNGIPNGTYGGTLTITLIE